LMWTITNFGALRTCQLPWCLLPAHSDVGVGRQCNTV
jgi:hypothetical protein